MTELMGEGAGAAPARGRARPKIVGVEGIENALELAALTLRPDEVSGRQLVKRLMLHLFKLRKKGFSYAQLTRLINDAIGEKTLDCSREQSRRITTNLSMKRRMSARNNSKRRYRSLLRSKN